MWVGLLKPMYSPNICVKITIEERIRMNPYYQELFERIEQLIADDLIEMVIKELFYCSAKETIYIHHILKQLAK